MSFLQPALLWLLPLILLPILIHLINQRRHRTVQWGAMMFLLSAKKMNKGMARLRQVLIMTARMLVVAGLLFAVCRPIASGWFGALAGGRPETVIVLLDRSSSMQVQQFETGRTKVSSGLGKILDMLTTIGYDGEVVLIDSNSLTARNLPAPESLRDIEEYRATASGGDIPRLLEAGMEYVTNNTTGRTDIWLCSDSQQEDWDADSGRWGTLRDSFSRLEGVRFQILNYADPPEENLSVRVDSVQRFESGDQAEVIIDLTIRRASPGGQDEIPLEFVVNGVRSVATVEIDQAEAKLVGHKIAVDKDIKSGWGRVELPADSNPGDNIFFFTYSRRAVQKTVLVTDDPQKVKAFKLAAEISLDRQTRAEAEVFSSGQIQEIDWKNTACIIWQTTLPGDYEARQLENFVAMGRPVIFLPPDQSDIDDTAFAGVRWTSWMEKTEGDGYELNDTWREDSDLLATSEDGIAMPLFDTSIYRYCGIEGGPIPLAAMKNGDVMLGRALSDGGGIYFLTTLPVSTHSSLARDGLVLFAMLQRAINSGLETIGNAKQMIAGTTLASTVSELAPVSTVDKTVIDGQEGSDLLPSERPFAGGIFGDEEQVIALNRPETEDHPVFLETEEVNGLFEGLDYS
ncbi:MAG: BatA domain-containing protein, partial [Planctomycetota bacterium]